MKTEDTEAARTLPRAFQRVGDGIIESMKGVSKCLARTETNGESNLMEEIADWKTCTMKHGLLSLLEITECLRAKKALFRNRPEITQSLL